MYPANKADLVKNGSVIDLNKGVLTFLSLPRLVLVNNLETQVLQWFQNIELHVISFYVGSQLNTLFAPQKEMHLIFFLY